jgi:hypothetical protein
MDMDKKAAVSEYLSEIGRKGGKVSAARRMTNFTREQRVAIAKKAINTRWKKKDVPADHL